MGETWLPVVGYESTYEVSDLGSVRRVGPARGARPGRHLVHRLSRSGYPVVRLTVCGVSVGAYVHRLVAMAHVGPPPGPEYEVNHKDRDRTNPAAANLEWVTRSGNIRHAHANGVTMPRGEAKAGHKLRWAQVNEIRSSNEAARSLARRLGVHHRTICDIRAGRKWRPRPEIETTLTRAQET